MQRCPPLHFTFWKAKSVTRAVAVHRVSTRGMARRRSSPRGAPLMPGAFLAASVLQRHRFGQRAWSIIVAVGAVDRPTFALASQLARERLVWVCDPTPSPCARRGSAPQRIAPQGLMRTCRRAARLPDYLVDRSAVRCDAALPLQSRCERG